MDEDALGELRWKVAIGCRILAHQGLAEDVLGHIGVRLDGGPDAVLVRCRGPRERGLLFTTPDDVRRVATAPPPVPPPADAGYAPPNELPIHVEVLRAHPEATAVVHAHPPAVIAAELAGLALPPLVGAYNIPAAKLAADGIPVFPRGVLINTPELGREMVAAMGRHPVCVLRGHGITTVGETVEQAVARALALDSLARMACRVARAGGTVRALAAADLEQLPDLGRGFNDVLLWRHHQARLELAGLGLAPPATPARGS